MSELDPFDLPDWLGEGAVTWATDQGLEGHRIAGFLQGSAGRTLTLDLLAVDQAYPAPVLEEVTRTGVHQSWRHGQVLLLDVDGRATVAVPGTSWTADLVLETLTRVARALGADPARWSVRLGLGSH